MENFLSLLDEIEWQVPYNASQGEDFYTVVRNNSFQLAFFHILFTDGDIETANASYKFIPSKFGNDYVIYKFVK